jgi:hypothetical protein
MLYNAIRLLTISFAASVSFIAARDYRSLSEYKYIDDLTGYYASYKSCFRVKVNEDDDSEGNSYFYNGKYYARYNRYVAFQLCNKCGDNCDDTTGYVTDLDNYVKTMAYYVKDYCTACQNCRRRLNGEEEDIYVDCSTCTKKCSVFNSASNGGNDAVDYLKCQAADNDGNTQFYQAPTCVDGVIQMGLFYDNECTVKTNQKPETLFDYRNFETIESMCFDCSSGNDICMYNDATHCVGSTTMKGDQDGDVCKKYSESVKEVVYSARKKKWNILPGILTFLIVASIFGFLSHTYYIRHRDKKIALSTQDHSSDVPSPNTTSDLPVLT